MRNFKIQNLKPIRMLKRFSIVALVAVFLVGCSSDKEDSKRSFEDKVSAFMNSNASIGVFGKADLNAILSKGKMEANPLVQMFAGQQLEMLKSELDLKTPVYYAFQAPNKAGGSPEVTYFFIKVKDLEKIKKDLKGERGFVLKETNGITYTEDGDFILGIRGDLAIVIIRGGDYNAATEVKKAFKFTEGKLADKKLQAEIDTKGDVVVNVRMENLPMGDSGMSKADVKGSTSQVTLNFEKGQVVLKGKVTYSRALKAKIGLSKSSAPLIAKKITDENGNVLMAMQMSMKMPKAMGNMIPLDKAMEGLMESAQMQLSGLVPGAVIASLEDGDNVKMPGSNAKIGGEMFEMFVDLDGVRKAMPNEQISGLLKDFDYISYSGDINAVEFVIKSHKTDENILLTIMNLSSQAMNGMMMSGAF